MALILRMLQAGVILSDYTRLMEEILKDNARPEAGAVSALEGEADAVCSQPPKRRIAFNERAPAGDQRELSVSLAYWAVFFTPVVLAKPVGKLPDTISGHERY
jgi:hypothetical protein